MHEETVRRLGTTWRRIALQVSLEGRYLDAVIYGYVSTSLDTLLWAVYCVSRARLEELREKNSLFLG